MNKGFVLTLFIAFVFLASGQVSWLENTAPMSVLRTPEKAVVIPKDDHVFLEDKTPGMILFSANFSNNLSGWTPSGPDGALWMVDSDGPSGQFANPGQEIINSQSANNGFLIFDADLSNPGGGPFLNRTGSLASPAIDLTGISAANLEFQQKYRFCCNASFFPKVEVSTYDFVTMAAYNVSIDGVESGIISPSELAKINLKGFLDTATNLSNFKFRFTFNGAGGTTHYYWQIDDVKVRESYLYDMKAMSKKMEMGDMKLPYYYIPTSQIAPITFSGVTRIDGSLTHTNVQLNVDINFGGGNTSSPLGDSLLSGQTGNLICAPWMAPAGIDTFYTATYTFTSDSLEGFPGDNVLTELFYLTDGIYSADNNTYKDFISNLSNQPNQPFKVGNVMEIMNDDMIDSMLVGVTATSTNIGQYVFGEIHKRINGVWTYWGSTAPTQITLENNGGFVRMPMMLPTPVYAGDTILVMSCHSGSNSTDVRFRVAQRTNTGNVLGYSANGSQFFLNTPRVVIVRLHLKGFLSTDELEREKVQMEVFPNPAYETLSLRFNTEQPGKGEVSLVDGSGRIVFVKGIQINGVTGQTESFDVRSVAPGWYWLSLRQNQSSSTIPVIVK